MTDYARLCRDAVAALEREPSLVHGDEFRLLLIEWLLLSAEGFETGDLTRRAIEDPDGTPGVRMARLLVASRA